MRNVTMVRRFLGSQMGSGALTVTVAGVLVAGAVATAQAHGTLGKRVEKPAVCLYFAYDEDEAMSHVKVSVTSPGGDTPFQTLATDRHGFACFAPDAPGDWRVVASDGMGHQQMMVVSFTGEERREALYAPQRLEAPGMGKLSGLLAGIGIIGGVTGLVAWYRSRRRRE